MTQHAPDCDPAAAPDDFRAMCAQIVAAVDRMPRVTIPPAFLAQVQTINERVAALVAGVRW